VSTIIESALWLFAAKFALIWWIVSFLAGMLNGFLSKHTDIGRDDTDPPRGRSNMTIHTDHATGCQYLQGKRGGLTPRLDANGRHMCSSTKDKP
jgi:hypothetical protein